MENLNKAVREAMRKDDTEALAKALNQLDGKYAVKYVLEELLNRKNAHTVAGALELVDETIHWTHGRFSRSVG